MLAGAVARYLCTAGVYLHYADALGTRGPRVARLFAAGLEIALLFLARYASDLARSGPPRSALSHSIALGVGAFWDEPRDGPFGARPGLEIALDSAVPGILDRATGPFLGVRGALRWRDGDLASARGDVVDWGALLSFTLGWHHLVRTHLVDPGERPAAMNTRLDALARLMTSALDEALSALDPAALVSDALPPDPLCAGRVLLVAAGKAAT